MRWFKHDTDSFFSEGIDALIEEFGYAGYGRWMRLLEVVALKMDETDRCHVDFSPQKWRLLLGLNQRKLTSFLTLTQNQLKTKVVCHENIIRIEIPNLLKKRDNWHTRLCSGSVVTTVATPSSSGSVSIIKPNINIKERKKVEKRSKETSVVSSAFGEFWDAYPKKRSKGAAEKVWLKLTPSAELFGIIIKGLGHCKSSSDWLKDQGQYIPHPATWLNARGWEDEHLAPATRQSQSPALRVAMANLGKHLPQIKKVEK